MSRLYAILIPLFLFWSAGASSTDASCRDPDVAQGFWNSAYAATPDATIEYFGHNFFQITSNKGTKIITDPIAPGMYPTPVVTPHVVTVGREHPNHNYVELAQGNPVILRGLGSYGAEWNKISTTVRDVLIYNVPVYQQAFGTALKGAAFVFDLGVICIAHLGDLSHPLTPEQIKAFRQSGRRHDSHRRHLYDAARHCSPSLRTTETKNRHPNALQRGYVTDRYVPERVSESPVA